MHAGAGASASTNNNGHAEEVGHNVDVPAEVLLDGEHVMSDRYAEVTGIAQLHTIKRTALRMCNRLVDFFHMLVYSCSTPPLCTTAFWGVAELKGLLLAAISMLLRTLLER